MPEAKDKATPGRSAAKAERVRDPKFTSVQLAELRAMRSGLTEEESKVSYWRRLIQARIDVINSDHTGEEPVEQLSRLLTDAQSSHRRVAALSVGPIDDIPPLPDLSALWNRVATETADERDALIADLERAEEDLSAYRRELHDRIDGVTAELITRYREEPELALVAMRERLGIA